MGIEDTIIKVVRDENNMLLGKLEDVINHAISGIKKGYGDVFLPDYVPVRKATELLGCSYKELLKRLNAINAKPEKSRPGGYAVYKKKRDGNKEHIPKNTIRSQRNKKYRKKIGCRRREKRL